MSYPFRDQYHQVRKQIVRSIDLLWPTASFQDRVETIHEKFRPPDNFKILSALPEQANQFLTHRQKKPDLEAVYKVKGRCTVDPKMGIIFSDKKVIWGSSDQPERERSPIFLSHIRKPGRKLDRAISLHHVHGDNYFHFFIYVLNKIFAVKEVNLPASIPFIIGEKTAGTPFFKQAQALGLFGKHEVIIQPSKQVFEVGECYLVRAFHIHNPYFDMLCELMGLEAEPQDGSPILLTRGNSATNGRHYRNQENLNGLAQEFGYQILDPGTLPITEQARIFSRAPVVVAPHGAGLTNLIFRSKKPCYLVELFNPGMVSGHYYQIAMEKGFGYTSQMTINPVGRDFTASTEVDLSALKSVLAQL